MPDRTRSVAVPHPFPFPFCICSVPVPYLFSIHSVLFPFCQCSIGKRSWNLFRKTRFPGTHLQVSRMLHSVKTFAVCVRAKIKTINLHFRGENVSRVTWKIWEEDCNITSRPVTESFFPKWYKATGSLCDCPRKRSNELAKHFQHHQWRNASKRRTFGSCSYTNTLSEI